MDREKFPKQAEIRIKYNEALERNIEIAKNSKYATEFKDPEVQDALRLLQKKVGLYGLLDIWPAAEVAEVLDGSPKERFVEDKLETVVRYVWKESIPEVLVKHIDGHVIGQDRIISYCYEAETDGYGCETGWLYFDFAVFSDENFRTVAFSGTFKTSIDVLHANQQELETWLYSREWDFEQKPLDELEKRYNEE